MINFGAIFAYAQFVAAILDTIENYALIKILFGAKQEIFAVVAYWCTVPKFVIVAVGIGYICFGLVLIIIRKLFEKNEIVSKSEPIFSRVAEINDPKLAPIKNKINKIKKEAFTIKENFFFRKKPLIYFVGGTKKGCILSKLSLSIFILLNN